MNEAAKSLIGGLLEKDPVKRLGIRDCSHQFYEPPQLDLQNQN